MRERRTWSRKLAAGSVSALIAGSMLVAASPARAEPPPSEVWHANLTNEQENGAAFDSNGNLYVAATYYGSPKVARLHSYDAAGNPRWTRTYRPKDAQGTNGFDVAVAPNDSVYLLAYSYIPAKKYFELSLVRYSAAGKLMWAKNQPNINAYAVAASNKAVVVAGNVGATKKAGRDAWVRSYTPKGTVRWTKKIDAGVRKNDVAWDVALAGDGTIYAVGYATLHATKPKDQDAAVWRLSPSGKLTGSRYTKGSVAGSYDVWTGIARTGTKFFVGGEVDETSSGSAPRDAFVNGKKVVAPQTLSWGSGYTQIWGVASAGSKLFAAGTSRDGANADARLVEMNASRVVQWTVTIDTGTDEYGFAVAADAGQVAIVGGTNFDGFVYVYPS
jgi:hypothetical protein